MQLSPRVEEFIERNFPAGEAAAIRDKLASLEGEVSDKGDKFSERIASAILILIKGGASDIDSEVAQAKKDWRDTLVEAGLGNKDWPVKVDALLGPSA